jgi:hypothetical protein
MSDVKIKIFDKAESEQTKIEASKKFVEDVPNNHSIILVHENDNNGVRIDAIVINDGTVEVEGLKPNHDLDMVFYPSIYEMLCEFPIIYQYQDSYDAD